MGKTVEYADGGLVAMKKKTKKNKNMNIDLLPFDDGNSNIETDGDCLKEKGDKHMETKRKSESKEHMEKRKSESKEYMEKKRKSESKEHTKERKSESKELMDKKRKSESKEDRETDGDHSMKKKRNKHSEKKRNSELKEDGDDDQQDKGNLVNEDQQDKGNLEKNKKRKRRCSSEKAELQENELDQNAGSDVGKDCELKHEKKKRDVVEGTRISMKNCSEDMFKKVDKKKKKKKMDGQNLDTEINRIVTKESTLKTRDKSMDKKKAKVKGHRVKNKAIESVENSTQKHKAKSRSKKVSFSGDVEVFPTSDTEPEKQKTNGDGLVRGKRFTPEEDEIVKQAVLDYIIAKGLGEEGLKMVLNCNSYKGMKKCWEEIAVCLPNRPRTSVYSRAHILFERAEIRSWTPEQIESLKEFRKQYGNDWKKIAAELGKHRRHIKDTWRRIKIENKKGRWSQEEYQKLYDLVNLDLQLKVSCEEEKRSMYGMLRDNIPWTAISEKLSTRADALCCIKWYNQLTSSLVAEKKWSDADDYRMIGALYKMDYACVEDVDWDDVLEHRPGEICLKRWNQMVKHIGDYRSKTFGEQVDILAKRYCPALADAREVWDNQPVVP